MLIIDAQKSVGEIKKNYSHFFERMLKIVVDLEKEVIALDAELHADLEQLLLDSGSEQQNLWGANIYFERPNFVEYTSLINIRPADNNFGMEINNIGVRRKIDEIVEKLITWDV